MFKNLHELITSMPTDLDCHKYLAMQRWEGGKAICPYCEHSKCYSLAGGKRYKCASCRKIFTATVGTIFQCSKVPLNKWLMAIYIMTGHKKGISSHQLGRDLGVTQTTAWFMLHRIRVIMKDETPAQFTGTVQADETYLSRKYRSDFVGLSEEEIDYKLRNRKDGKGAVLAVVDAQTKKVKVKALNRIEGADIATFVRDNVQAGADLHTDQSNMYSQLNSEYHRETVNHSRHEWVRMSVTNKKVHTNNAENFFSVLKRTVFATYHQISYKHLSRYCGETAFRYNNRDLKDYKRFIMTMQYVKDVRLTYKQLVGKNPIKRVS
jgi:transposase-like protein